MAVLLSILGIIMGKYFSYYLILKDVITEDYGKEAASTLSIFSSDVFQFFREDIGSILDIYDAIWLILAVITAWRITKGIGIKLKKRKQFQNS